MGSMASSVLADLPRAEEMGPTTQEGKILTLVATSWREVGDTDIVGAEHLCSSIRRDRTPTGGIGHRLCGGSIIYIIISGENWLGCPRRSQHLGFLCPFSLGSHRSLPNITPCHADTMGSQYMHNTKVISPLEILCFCWFWALFVVIWLLNFTPTIV